QMLSVKEGKFPTLMLNKNSVDILKGKRTVWMYTAPVPTTGEADYDEQLFSILRTLRKEMADRDNVPPYVLFSDMTLKECCRYFPETKEEMLDIKGIGEKKFETYGPPFLEKIVAWREEHPAIKPARKINDFRGPTAKKQPAQQTDGPSHMESYQLFQHGKSIKDIAVIRDMNKQTIEHHIFKAYKDGYPIAWEIFFTNEEEMNVIEVRKHVDEARLKQLKDNVTDTSDYTKIKAVLIKKRI